MTTIEVDFEVYKKLTVMRETERMTVNDVIRKLLVLPEDSVEQDIEDIVKDLVSSWFIKGATFPARTQFRAEYKGNIFFGEVIDAALVVNGKAFKSPSSAATEITGNSVNGWKFWECKFPDEVKWQPISKFKK